MGVIYRASLRTTRMTAVRDDIDVGAGAGTVEIRDASTTVLVSFTLSDPCGTVSGDVLTMSGMPKTANAVATGAADNAVIKESAGTIIVSGLTVGTSGTNVIISPSTSITSGQQCQLTSLTITHNTSGV